MADAINELLNKVVAEHAAAKSAEGEQVAQGPVHTHELVDKQTGQVVGTYSTRNRAMNVRDKKDNEYGAYRYLVRPIPLGKPG